MVKKVSFTHSTIILRTEDTFLAFLYHLFSYVILLPVLDAFFLESEVPVDDVKVQSANHKYRWFTIVQYFTLPNSSFNNKTTEQQSTSLKMKLTSTHNQLKYWIFSQVLIFLAFKLMDENQWVIDAINDLSMAYWLVIDFSLIIWPID